MESPAIRKFGSLGVQSIALSDLLTERRGAGNWHLTLAPPSSKVNLEI